MISFRKFHQSSIRDQRHALLAYVQPKITTNKPQYSFIFPGALDTEKSGHRPHIIVQTQGPVYLQYGNHNQMNSHTHTDRDSDGGSPEYVLESDSEEDNTNVNHEIPSVRINSIQDTGDQLPTVLYNGTTV